MEGLLPGRNRWGVCAVIRASIAPETIATIVTLELLCSLGS
jgi:hypothetical protein